MFSQLRRKSAASRFDPSKIHYLHIGKTAGNQIKRILGEVEKTHPDIRFQLHPHSTRLERLSADTRYFFSIRHPVTRFKAAFYERKRQDHGRNVWSADEAESFRHFDHATDLAEVLFDDSPQGEMARYSMWSIEHARKFHAQWFVPLRHFLNRQPPVWIIRQESFDADIDRFFTRLGLAGDRSYRADPASAKITSYDGIPELSDTAVHNLEGWFQADIAFYRDCCNWLDRQEAE